MKAKEIEKKIREILAKNKAEDTSEIFLFEVDPGTFVVEYDDGDVDFSKLNFHKDGTPRFSFTITGGLNGEGKWEDYMKDLSEKFKELEDETGLKLDIEVLQNDIADDVWTAQCFLYDIDHIITDKIKKILNPKLWNSDNSLKPEIKDQVEKLVEFFKQWLDELKIDFKYDDVILVGSNASYNYNSKSDLDVHIIVPDVDEKVLSLYDSYKALFNKTYDVKFERIPVELYIQNDISDLTSKGVYSIYKGWIKEPKKEDVKEVDIREDLATYVDEYKQLVETKDLEKIKAFIDKLYELRKEGLSKNDEFAKENLIFKEFRKHGYLKKLKTLQIKLESKELSLSDSKIDDVIRKTNKGYVIYSEKGKRLSKPFSSKEDAEERLKEIEMFKHMKDSASEDDYEIRKDKDHYYVYRNGKFVSSADTPLEAKEDIEEDIKERNKKKIVIVSVQDMVNGGNWIQTLDMINNSVEETVNQCKKDLGKGYGVRYIRTVVE